MTADTALVASRIAIGLVRCPHYAGATAGVCPVPELELPLWHGLYSVSSSFSSGNGHAVGAMLNARAAATYSRAGSSLQGARGFLWARSGQRCKTSLTPLLLTNDGGCQGEYDRGQTTSAIPRSTLSL